MCVRIECSGTVSSNAIGRGGLDRPCHFCCGFALTEGKLVHDRSFKVVMTPISLWAEAFSAHIPSEGAWRMPLKVLELMRQMQQQEGVEPDPVTSPRIVIEYATVATL
jgi:hypothetical protein